MTRQMMRNCLQSVLAAVGLLLGAGCIDVEYTGQKFPPLPEGTLPHYYALKKPVPQGQYRTIGRFKVTAPENTDQDDVIDELLETARKNGADAVKVEFFDRVETGDLPVEQETRDIGMSTILSRQGRLPDGSYIYTDSFGEKTTPPKRMKSFELLAQGLMLVKTERFEQIVAEWKADQRQLAEQLNTPSAKADPAQAASLDEAAAAVMEKSVAPEHTNPAPPPPHLKDQQPVQLQLRDEPLTL